MLTEIAHALRRTRATLLQDLVGATALVVMMVALLHFPAF